MNFKKEIEINNLPKHIAIIMDGNGRWAQARGQVRINGYRRGVEVVREVTSLCAKAGVSFLTLFAFSSENWYRPAREVRGLMSLFSSYLKQEAKVLRDDNIRLKIIGNRDRFSQRLNQQIDKAEKLTKNGELNLHIYVDYGGRWEIAEAARELAAKVVSGDLSLDQVNADNLDEYFSAEAPMPPDLCIRTAGEQRISNFMLWQMAYTELYFTDCYWPDFDENTFQQAIEDYYSRQRRFGSREPEKN